MSHPAMLGNSIHLDLPCTADELGNDHWMLLQKSIRGLFCQSTREKKNKLVALCESAACVDFRFRFVWL